jgi:Pyruvate/2-oxoacid:ferredoxin oxidoreductase gamma subunit
LWLLYSGRWSWPAGLAILAGLTLICAVIEILTPIKTGPEPVIVVTKVPAHVKKTKKHRTYCLPMSTIVSEFTTQMTINTSMLGVIAMGFLIAFVVELEMIRTFKPDFVKRAWQVLKVPMIPLASIFVAWMAARLIDLIY